MYCTRLPIFSLVPFVFPCISDYTKLLGKPTEPSVRPLLWVGVAAWVAGRQCCASGSVGSVNFWDSRICHSLYGSGSFHHQANKFWKNGFPNILDFVMTFYLWRLMQIYLTKRSKQKNLFNASILKANYKKVGPGSRSVNQWYGSGSIHVTDPQHCWQVQGYLYLTFLGVATLPPLSPPPPLHICTQ